MFWILVFASMNEVYVQRTFNATERPRSYPWHKITATPSSLSAKFLSFSHQVEFHDQLNSKFYLSSVQVKFQLQPVPIGQEMASQ